jgi:hypothetical protein
VGFGANMLGSSNASNSCDQCGYKLMLPHSRNSASFPAAAFKPWD